MDRFRWGNVMGISIGIFFGFASGAALTGYCLSARHPFWQGEGSDWVTAAGTWAAALVTSVAIYYAVSSGQRAIHAARELQDREHEAAEKVRNELRIAEHRRVDERNRLVAVAYRDELPGFIVKSIEVTHMLNDQRFANYLQLAFKYVARFPTPVLDRFGFDPTAMSEQLANVFVLAAVKINRVRNFAESNLGAIGEWIPETRRRAAEQLLFHLKNAREATEVAYRAACNIAGDDAGYPVERLHDAGDEAFADRIDLDVFAASAGGAAATSSDPGTERSD